MTISLLITGWNFKIEVHQVHKGDFIAKTLNLPPLSVVAVNPHRFKLVAPTGTYYNTICLFQ